MNEDEAIVQRLHAVSHNASWKSLTNDIWSTATNAIAPAPGIAGGDVLFAAAAPVTLVPQHYRRTEKAAAASGVVAAVSPRGVAARRHLALAELARLARRDLEVAARVREANQMLVRAVRDSEAAQGVAIPSEALDALTGEIMIDPVVVSAHPGEQLRGSAQHMNRSTAEALAFRLFVTAFSHCSGVVILSDSAPLGSMGPAESLAASSLAFALSHRNAAQFLQRFVAPFATAAVAADAERREGIAVFKRRLLMSVECVRHRLCDQLLAPGGRGGASDTDLSATTSLDVVFANAALRGWDDAERILHDLGLADSAALPPAENAGAVAAPADTRVQRARPGALNSSQLSAWAYANSGVYSPLAPPSQLVLTPSRSGQTLPLPTLSTPQQRGRAGSVTQSTFRARDEANVALLHRRNLHSPPSAPLIPPPPPGAGLSAPSPSSSPVAEALARRRTSVGGLVATPRRPTSGSGANSTLFNFPLTPPASGGFFSPLPPPPSTSAELYQQEQLRRRLRALESLETNGRGLVLDDYTVSTQRLAAREVRARSAALERARASERARRRASEAEAHEQALHRIRTRGGGGGGGTAAAATTAAVVAKPPRPNSSSLGERLATTKSAAKPSATASLLAASATDLSHDDAPSLESTLQSALMMVPPGAIASGGDDSGRTQNLDASAAQFAAAVDVDVGRSAPPPEAHAAAAAVVAVVNVPTATPVTDECDQLDDGAPADAAVLDVVAPAESPASAAAALALAEQRLLQTVAALERQLELPQPAPAKPRAAAAAAQPPVPPAIVAEHPPKRGKGTHAEQPPSPVVATDKLGAAIIAAAEAALVRGALAMASNAALEAAVWSWHERSGDYAERLRAACAWVARVERRARAEALRRTQLSRGVPVRNDDGAPCANTSDDEDVVVDDGTRAAALSPSSSRRRRRRRHDVSALSPARVLSAATAAALARRAVYPVRVCVAQQRDAPPSPSNDDEPASEANGAASTPEQRRYVPPPPPPPRQREFPTAGPVRQHNKPRQPRGSRAETASAGTSPRRPLPPAPPLIVPDFLRRDDAAGSAQRRLAAAAARSEALLHERLARANDAARQNIAAQRAGSARGAAAAPLASWRRRLHAPSSIVNNNDELDASWNGEGVDDDNCDDDDGSSWCEDDDDAVGDSKALPVAAVATLRAATARERARLARAADEAAQRMIGLHSATAVASHRPDSNGTAAAAVAPLPPSARGVEGGEGRPRDEPPPPPDVELPSSHLQRELAKQFLDFDVARARKEAERKRELGPLYFEPIEWADDRAARERLREQQVHEAVRGATYEQLRARWGGDTGCDGGCDAAAVASPKAAAPAMLPRPPLPHAALSARLRPPSSSSLPARALLPRPGTGGSTNSSGVGGDANRVGSASAAGREAFLAKVRARLDEAAPQLCTSPTSR